MFEATFPQLIEKVGPLLAKHRGIDVDQQYALLK